MTSNLNGFDNTLPAIILEKWHRTNRYYAVRYISNSYLFRATLMTRLFMNRVKSLKSPCSIINGKLSSSNPESFLLIPQVTVTWNLKTANDLQKRHVKRLHNRFWYYFIVFNTSFQYFICPFAAEFVRTFNFRLIGTDHCGLFLKFC